MAPKSHELRLILRAQAGDRGAYGQLIELHEERLHAFVLGIVRQPALAEDLMQEILFRVYQKLPWLREPELFRSWLYRIAAREACRAATRSRRQAGVELDEERLVQEEPEPPDPLLLSRLPALLDRLSPASRAVVLLHYYEERSLDEIAAILGAPLGTVKSRLSYGLSTLRAQLAETQT